MTLSLHKVPFIQWTYTGGDISNMTPLSSRMASASDNLRQSLPIFLAFALLSIILNVDNLMLAQAWFGLRVLYLLGAIFNLYQYKLIRPIIWIPSVVILVLMGCNLYI
tara:strand:+ start:1253 stop:1576 length:324 start_codon:yes stop_codon:yes gene_type:complete